MRCLCGFPLWRSLLLHSLLQNYGLTGWLQISSRWHVLPNESYDISRLKNRCDLLVLQTSKTFASVHTHLWNCSIVEARRGHWASWNRMKWWIILNNSNYFIISGALSLHMCWEDSCRQINITAALSTSSCHRLICCRQLFGVDWHRRSCDCRLVVWDLLKRNALRVLVFQISLNWQLCSYVLDLNWISCMSTWPFT